VYTSLPEPIAAYIDGANAQDVGAVAACFHEDALVRDEGRDRQGIAAIREWEEEVSNKYHPLAEVIDVVETAGKTIVTCLVSGTFPGSPIELRYAFTLDGGKITLLEIRS
jgi:ketosteroid isomerase-like protein